VTEPIPNYMKPIQSTADVCEEECSVCRLPGVNVSETDVIQEQKHSCDPYGYVLGHRKWCWQSAWSNHWTRTLWHLQTFL